MILTRTIQSLGDAVSALFHRRSSMLPEPTQFQRTIITKPKVDPGILKSYLEAGTSFATEAAYLPCFGKCSGFEDLLRKWASEEKKYFDLGFRTISLDAFIRYVRGVSIEHLLNQPRDIWEEPVSHAEIFRKNLLDKYEPKVKTKINESGNIRAVKFALPSTEQFLNPSAKSNSNYITYTCITRQA